MPDSEYLELVNRSSSLPKQFPLLANDVGVIGSDYYNNENNEGHTVSQFLNSGYEGAVVEEGERIGQGIFKPFSSTDDNQVEAERTGGFDLSEQR